jgi:hypothetical protein
MIGILIATIASVGIQFATKKTTEKTIDVRSGQQNGAMTVAARTFSNSQRTTIMNAISAAGGNAVAYHVSDMIAAGILDPSVSPTTSTLGTWCLEFRTYNAGANLQGALTVVGETNPNTAIDAALVAQNAGQAFTGVVQGGVAVYPAGSQPLSAFTGPNACAPGANSYVSIITDADSIGTTSYWARVAIPGNPSANVAAVDESLGGNNLLAINNATGTGAASFGTFVATTSMTSPYYYVTSDRRAKTNVKRLKNPWRLLAPIHGDSWNFLADGSASDGVIAQDVALSMPELVHVDAMGRLQVNYNGLHGAQIEALKDLRRTSAANAKAQLRDRAEIAHLRRMVNRLLKEKHEVGS